MDLWRSGSRNPKPNLADLRAALFEFRDRRNNTGLSNALKYRTPIQARRDFSIERKLAACFNGLNLLSVALSRPSGATQAGVHD
jgi:hypothetical protein